MQSTTSSEPQSKKYITRNTESGDRYSATEELWEKYRAAVSAGDEATMLFLEEGNDEDFYYDPDE